MSRIAFLAREAFVNLRRNALVVTGAANDNEAKIASGHHDVDLSMLDGSNGFRLDDVTLARPSLGDVFLHHTGRALRD